VPGRFLAPPLPTPPWLPCSTPIVGLDPIRSIFCVEVSPLALALEFGDNAAMNLDDVETALADAELVACAQAPLVEAKQLRDACLASDIPVLLDRGGCCGQGGSGCGCAPKMQLLARAEDVPRVGRLLHDRWRDLALREGTITPPRRWCRAPVPTAACSSSSFSVTMQRRSRERP
jgi:hypothetical protein